MKNFLLRIMWTCENSETCIISRDNKEHLDQNENKFFQFLIFIPWERCLFFSEYYLYYDST